MGCIQSNPEDLNPRPAANGTDTNDVPVPEKNHGKVVVAGPAPEASDLISPMVALGAGCFWGVQKFVEKGQVYYIICRSNM